MKDLVYIKKIGTRHYRVYYRKVKLNDSCHWELTNEYYEDNYSSYFEAKIKLKNMVDFYQQHHLI